MPSSNARPLGPRIFEMIEALAQFTQAEGELTRCSFTPEAAKASDCVLAWMTDAGMRTHIDEIGNVIGRYPGTDPDAPALMVGSHLDTVRNAGKYDGMLGVVTPIACIEQLHERGETLPFPIEVIAFCDEEGTRFQATLLGSRAVAGTFDKEVLTSVDAQDISLASAMEAAGFPAEHIPKAKRASGSVRGFVEIHIEQGPVLEQHGLPVGVVTAIAGAARYRVRISGMAGHAGTVPMSMRQDALAGAADAILLVERVCTDSDGVVGTVGRISAAPGAVNVIPGSVEFTIDIRSGDDALRQQAFAEIDAAIRAIGDRRGLDVDIEQFHANDSAVCDERLSDELATAVADCGLRVHRLASGAGHDAMAMEALTPMAMLFVRCRAGISHHPAEEITCADATEAGNVLLTLMRNLAAKSEHA